MKFLCNVSTFDVIDRAAKELSVEWPELGTFVDIADDRLIGIARLLGMEEMAPSNEEAMLRLGLQLVSWDIKHVDFPRRFGKTKASDTIAHLMQDANIPVLSGALPAFDPDHPLEEKVFEPTNTLPLPQSLPTPPQPSPFLRPHSLRSGAQSSRGEGVGGEKAVCEICGKPVVNKKKKTCSQECLAESRRRYNREYQRRLHEKVVSVRKDKKKVEAAGNESVPLSRPEQMI